MIYQIRNLKFTYPQIILGSAALTGALAELTSFGSTRFQLSAGYLITAVVLTTLRLQNTAIETKTVFSHTTTRATTTATTVFVSITVLLVARSILAVFRSIEPQDFGGFGTIAGEDNAAWLSIITNWYHETSLVSTFGDTAIIFIVAFVALVSALSLGRLGVSTVGDLVIHLNLIYALIHVLTAAAYFRLWRQLIRTTSPKIIPLLLVFTFSTVQQMWLHITRDYGHLTAILSCQLFSYFAFNLVFKEGRSRFQTGLELAMAAGSCFLWLPLKPIGIMLMSLASLSFMSGVLDLSRGHRRGKNLLRTVLVMGAAGLLILAKAGISILKNLARDARELISLDGGTTQLTAGHFIVVCCVSALLVSQTHRGAIRGLVGVLFIYVGSIVAYSFAMTGTINYGSSKLVWWFLGFLFTFGGHALVIIRTERTPGPAACSPQLKFLIDAFAASILVLSLGLVVAKNTSIDLLSPPEATWVSHTESSNEIWWGAAEEILSSSVLDGSLGCVEINQDGYPIPTWDGYLCSRMLGWSMAWRQKGVDPDVQFRQFAMKDQTAEGTIVNLVETEFSNLERTIVLLKNGRYSEQMRLLDFLIQQAGYGE